MVLAQSLFKVLKARAPRATIDVVAPLWSEPLLARMPEVDEAILLDAGHGELGLRKRIRLGRSLRGRDYDQAILLPNSLKSALVPFVARARRRTGFRGEMRWGLLNDIRPLDRVRLPKTVERFVALGIEPGEALPAIPEPRLVTDAANAQAALESQHLALPDRPVLGLCPGAEYGPAKRWPVEHYAAVARAKLDAGWAVWLFGSAKDAEVTRALNAATQGRCVDFTGRTRLDEAIDLLALTTVVVSNDSGLMHVAAATGRPVVALYGSTDPHHTPPMSSAARVLHLALPCGPCFERACPLGHTRCLTEIAPDRVAKALDDLA